MGSFFDTIVDIFNQGPDDWRGRMGDAIELESPDGSEFRAKWRGDTRDMDKKLGVFVYPRVKGNVVQDLEVNSARYSIPLYFDGKDCDTTAKSFFQAAKESGVWSITHPIHGYLELQLMSIRENMDLVSNGGFILIETEWIEPLDPSTLLTAAELEGLITAGVDDLNISAAEQFAADLDDTTEALRENIENAVAGVQNLVDAALDPLFSVVDSLDNLILSVNNGIQDTLDAVVLEPLVLAGQTQQLIQLPQMGANDISSRLDYYDDLADDFSGTLPASTNTKRKHYNQAVIAELAITSVIASYAKIVVSGISAAQLGRTIASGRLTAEQILSGVSPSIQTIPGLSTFRIDSLDPIQTRAQAIEVAVRLADKFTELVGALETIQTQFEDLDIDEQYFSQRQTYPQAARLIALVIQYLMLTAFDLAVERRITLAKPRSPIEITVTEYGTLGENDVYLDLFLLSNDLHGKDIYLLPAGREVVIYV